VSARVTGNPSITRYRTRKTLPGMKPELAEGTETHIRRVYRLRMPLHVSSASREPPKPRSMPSTCTKTQCSEQLRASLNVRA